MDDQPIFFRRDEAAGQIYRFAVDPWVSAPRVWFNAKAQDGTTGEVTNSAVFDLGVEDVDELVLALLKWKAEQKQQQQKAA